ncbi:MAG: holo-[acyl-carrier-protein] synthase [Chitinivibrionales bacterium]|nr:holo-[acyl-carrier-protein] synthase [Chitinivibrionales bacterium]
MIIGLGVDIVEIGRIERLITAYDDHFLDKVYTAAEKRHCLQKAHPAIHFSGRWASKEAFYKALPVDIQPLANWKSIEIISTEGTLKPILVVCNQRLEKKMQDRGVTQKLVSISHERKQCIATVIIA